MCGNCPHPSEAFDSNTRIVERGGFEVEAYSCMKGFGGARLKKMTWNRAQKSWRAEAVKLLHVGFWKGEV